MPERRYETSWSSLASHSPGWIFSIRSSGYGSNLTIDGTVECDAAVMDGLLGDFGSVGAVSGLEIFMTNYPTG